MIKRYLIVCFFVAISGYLSAQVPVVQWQKALGGTGYESAGCIIPTVDGQYLVVGSTESSDGDVPTAYGYSDCWISKLDTSGNMVWSRTLGGSYGDYGINVRQTPDSGFIMVGYTSSSDGDLTGNYGKTDAWVVRLSDTGAIEWQRHFGGSDFDVALSVDLTLDGGYVVAGWTKSNDGDISGSHGNEDAWVIRLDGSGSPMWMKVFGGTLADHGTAIRQRPDSSYILSGFARSSDGDMSFNHGAYDIWVAGLSPEGNLIWQRSYGGSGNDLNGDHSATGALVAASGGGMALAGWTSSPDGDVTGHQGDYDFWVLRLSDTGAIHWQKTLGGTGEEEANAVIETADGGFILAGTTNSQDGQVSGMQGIFDMWLVKVDSAGSLDWEQCLGGAGKEVAYSLTETADPGLVVAGFANQNGGMVTGVHGSHDMWVVKLTYPILNKAEEPLSKTPALFPNPATNTINVTGLEHPALIRIFNTLGQLVIVSSRSPVAIGSLPNGFYYLTVHGPDGNSVLKGRFLKQ